MVEESDAEESESENSSSDTDSSTETETETEAESNSGLNPVDADFRLRFGALVESNARRLARRIYKKGAIAPSDISLIAEAMGISYNAANHWSTTCDPIPDETTLKNQLIELGMAT